MRTFLLCIAAVFAVLPAACSGGGGDDGGSSNLRVNLTDAPMMGMRAVNVTITSVRVHQSADAAPGAAGWRDMPVTAAMPVDLMRLRGGVLYELCSERLDPGHYQQVRLAVMPNAGAGPPYRNSVTTMDGAVHPVDMPADIKVLHSFTTVDGRLTDLTLDFDAEQSMHQRGSGTYYMQPVVHASSMMH
jgi:hypothetical protein